MSIFNLLLNLSSALEKGKALEDAETWKDRKVAIGNLTLVLVFGLNIAQQFGYDFGITEAEVTQLSGAIGAIGVTVFTYLHHATDVTKGFKNK
jgi:hypothetical protein